MKLVNIYILMLLGWSLFAIPEAEAQKWTLDRCLDTALVHNKGVQIGQNEVRMGIQRQKEAQANLLPKLSANADYKYFVSLPYQLLPLSALNPTAPDGVFREAQFGVPHNINANIQLILPLYSPQLYGGVESARVAMEIEELQLEKTKEQLYFDIAQLFYNAQLLAQQLAFLDSNTNNTRRLRQNVLLLQSQQMATGTEVLKVELQLQQLITQRATVLSKYDQVLNGLKMAIGLPLISDFDIETGVQMPQDVSYESRNSLEWKLIQTRRSLVNNELKVLNRSRYLPSVALTAMYGTTGFGYNGEPSSFLDFYPIGLAGLQISYPLFNGSVTQRKITQKSLELNNIELQLAMINDQNQVQIENAAMQRTIAKQTAAHAAAQIKLAQQIYEQSLLQQAQETASLTDVMLADNALREAQQLYITATIEYLKADLELKRSKGQLNINN